MTDGSPVSLHAPTFRQRPPAALSRPHVSSGGVIDAPSICLTASRLERREVALMRVHDSIGWVTALAAASIAAVPAARADRPAPRTSATAAAVTDMVYSCIDNRGNPRIVNGPGQCSKGEGDLSWNQVGPLGPTGPQGAAGQVGPMGPVGPTGPQGAQGATGAQGDAGPMGAMGPAGL